MKDGEANKERKLATEGVWHQERKTFKVKGRGIGGVKTKENNTRLKGERDLIGREGR